MDNNQTTVKMTDAEALRVDHIIRGITSKKKYTYAGFSSRFGREDVIQELWLKALEVWQEQLSLDLEDRLNVIAKACKDKLVDLVRHHIRRPATAVDPSIFDYEDNAESGAEYHYGDEIAGFSSKFTSPTEYALIKDMLSLFSEGSKERIFMETLVKLLVDMPGETVDASEFSTLFGRDGEYDSWLAQKLGWAGSCSRSYQGLKNRVQAELLASGFADRLKSSKAADRLRKLGYVF